MAIISYSKRETHNLGNYESISIEISIEDEPEGYESRDDCYDRLKLWVNEKLTTSFKSNKIIPTIKSKGEPVIQTAFLTTFDHLKTKISNLIKIDRTNQDKIKALLAAFGAVKLSDLSTENMEKVNSAIDKGDF